MGFKNPAEAIRVYRYADIAGGGAVFLRASHGVWREVAPFPMAWKISTGVHLKICQTKNIRVY